MPGSFFSRRDAGSGVRKLPSPLRIGHVYLDAKRRMVYCLNETARQLVREGLPLTREELQRQPLRTPTGDVVTTADLPLLRALRERTPQEATFVWSRPPLPTQQMSWSAAPLQGADGEIVGVVGSVTVANPEPDWQELAGLAHDLRSPLQSLRLLVPLLESMPLLHTEALELLERIRSATDRALAVGLDLLEWCRAPTQGGRRVERKWFALEPFLKSLAVEHLASAQRKGITLTTDLAEAAGLEIESDRVRLGRLLSNLLSNAVRYTPAGQVRVRVSWREASGDTPRMLSLAIQDTGSGLTAEEKESVFQTFERGKAGKDSDSGGSGVGLAVVDRLVQDLDLTLEVYSEHGRGSNFEVLLPRQSVRSTVS